MTTIKVPASLRDRIRHAAGAHHEPQAATLARALDALERADLLAELAAWQPDEAYLDEMREWQAADFGTALG